jgi:mono/diheme cytochrome c family protein
MKPLFALAAGALMMTGCMDQYNPVPYWQQFKKEREITSAKHPKLTDKGEMPVREAAASGSEDPIAGKYSSLCSSCHGADGQANGAAALAMNPKPRNFHDKAWQAKVDDIHIAKVIKEGGAANGLSGTMPPWGAVLSDDDVKGLVAMIRAWGK